MRIIVDLQIAQQDINLGGCGADIIELVKELAADTEVDVFVALNGFFLEESIAVRKALRSSIAPEKIFTWSPLEMPPGSLWQRQVNEIIRLSSILRFDPDVVLVPGEVNENDSRLIFSYGVDSVRPIFLVSKSIIGLAVATDKKNKIELDSLLETVVKSSEQAKEIIDFCNENISTQSRLDHLLTTGIRPKLAYVSPLPDEKSGIAFYSAELIRALIHYYDVDVIVTQETVADTWLNENCGIFTPEYLVKNSGLYERVIYHFGNSHFHSHMFELLACVPGVVVLHDFFLGDLGYYIQGQKERNSWFWQSLYFSHGYKAVAEGTKAQDLHALIAKYPASFEVFKQSKSIIVHSSYAKKLAEAYFPKFESFSCFEIPLLRQPVSSVNKTEARKKLGLSPGDFVVCSFGLLGRHKLNSRLIEAWFASPLASSSECKLIFVGALPDDSYGDYILDQVSTDEDIVITGWVDEVTYRNYLAAADIAVQLRSESRGETSAAVLDCMNYSLATIVNANGSMNELAADGVVTLEHENDSDELAKDLSFALERLWRNDGLRHSIASCALQTIRTKHSPENCAKYYAEIIERDRILSQFDYKSLVNAIALSGPPALGGDERVEMAYRLSRNFPMKTAKSQLLIDVSITSENDLRTGIQRVVRAIVHALIGMELPTYRIEPVYLSDEGGRWHYRYARQWTSQLIGVTSDWAKDEPIDYNSGDLFLIADFISGILPIVMKAGIYDALRSEGVQVKALIYDILPISLPSMFPDNTDLNHKSWLESVFKLDGAVCISKSVADEVGAWKQRNTSVDLNDFSIDWFHLGADIESSSPTSGFPDDYPATIEFIKKRPSFLMVGTIEPRKGVSQVVEAFQSLWDEGIDINLVLVGKKGWMVDELSGKIKSSAVYKDKLFWLEGISDEYLENVYDVSTCLIAASKGEGFGLPLIEAAQHKLPIIARDLPVFREVAGEYAFYFQGEEPADVAAAIKDWLHLYKHEKYPRSDDMPWVTWQESAKQLLTALDIK